MANPEHLKILKQGVEAWNAWRKVTEPIPGSINSRFGELRYEVHRNADLSWVDLRNTNLSRADLRNTSLTQADLRNAVLSEADLSGADLDGVNLFHADLTHANLNGTDLGGAFFKGADLRDASLFNTNLRWANLSGANLKRANLERSSLVETRLEQTNFSEATIGLAILSDVDLSEALGLETMIHSGPSTIGFDTFYKSRGKIPESFLRGCGVPEELILYLPSLVNQPSQFYSCFISYSHEDKAFARLLHDRLQGQGIRCWLDEHQLLPGDDIHDRIDQGIRLWDKVLLCASKSSLTSWWVDGEINRAFQKEAQIMKERGKKVLALIPLNLDGFLLSDDYQSGKKSEIKSRVAANFVGWEKDHALFDRELGKVIRALKTDDAGREKPPQSKL